MTDAERKLLVWCAIMLVRSAPLTSDEADEIDQLIADARSPYDTTPLPGEFSDLRTEVLVFLGEDWFYAKNVRLAGRSPAELIGTPEEFQVRLILRSIKGADLS